MSAEATAGFNKFIVAAEIRLEPRFSGRNFLWSDEIPGMRQQLLKGSIIAQPAQGNGVVSIKGGLIQDWIGAVFIPGASLRDALFVALDYAHHGDIYRPEVVDARVESRLGDELQVYMRIVKSKFMLSAVFNTDHTIHYINLDPKRAYSRSYSKRINEVASPGQAGEHELPVGKDRGFLWRMDSYWFFEERDGGVYVACEYITLTRDLPFGTGLILGPILRDLPGESLRISLEQTRKAVVALSRAGK